MDSSIVYVLQLDNWVPFTTEDYKICGCSSDNEGQDYLFNKYKDDPRYNERYLEEEREFETNTTPDGGEDKE